jgi:hypothetical protein
MESSANRVGPPPCRIDIILEHAHAAVAGFTGNLDSAYWVTDPTTARRMALARDAGGSFGFRDRAAVSCSRCRCSPSAAHRT